MENVIIMKDSITKAVDNYLAANEEFKWEASLRHDTYKAYKEHRSNVEKGLQYYVGYGVLVSQYQEDFMGAVEYGLQEFVNRGNYKAAAKVRDFIVRNNVAMPLMN